MFVDLAAVPEAERVHWDIRQGEYEGEFWCVFKPQSSLQVIRTLSLIGNDNVNSINLAGFSWVVHLDNGSAAPNAKVY